MRNGTPLGGALRDEEPLRWRGEGKPPGPGDRKDTHQRADIDTLSRAEATTLMRYVARRVGCREEALDLVQEASSRFLGLHRAQRKSVDRPEAYLQRVARNLLHDRAKTNMRRAAHLHVVADVACPVRTSSIFSKPEICCGVSKQLC